VIRKDKPGHPKPGAPKEERKMYQLKELATGRILYETRNAALVEAMQTKLLMNGFNTVIATIYE
jgi:hypothetical protein